MLYFQYIKSWKKSYTRRGEICIDQASVYGIDLDEDSDGQAFNLICGTIQYFVEDHSLIGYDDETDSYYLVHSDNKEEQ